MKSNQNNPFPGDSSNQGFFTKVYELVKLVPPGRVTSYGAIASYLGSPGAARMVGWAMNQCHSHSEYVPANRVVNRLGLLTGKHHFEGRNLMQELLENGESNVHVLWEVPQSNFF